MIEFERRSKNSIVGALSRLDSIAIDNEVANELGSVVFSFACPVADVDHLDFKIDWIAKQQSDETIAFVTNCLMPNSRPDPVYVKIFDVRVLFRCLVAPDNWTQHAITLYKLAVFTRFIVLAALWEQVLRSLHEPGNHGYENSLQKIAQRFWWHRYRACLRP